MGNTDGHCKPYCSKHLILMQARHLLDSQLTLRRASSSIHFMISSSTNDSSSMSDFFAKSYAVREENSRTLIILQHG